MTKDYTKIAQEVISWWHPEGRNTVEAIAQYLQERDQEDAELENSNKK